MTAIQFLAPDAINHTPVSAATPLPMQSIVGGAAISESNPSFARQPATTGVHRLPAAAGTVNATSAAAGVKKLRQISVTNAATSIRYVKLYDKASAPTVGTDTPLLVYGVPASGGIALDMNHLFTLGIAYGFTTGAADNNSGPVVANDLLAFQLIWD